MSKSVTYAKLHTNLFMPVGGELGPTLAVGSKGEKQITSMSVDDAFLSVTVVHKGNTTTLLTPVSNIINAIASEKAKTVE